MKRITAFLFISLLLLFISTAFAQSPEITNGLNYLTTTQNPDGSWGYAESNTEVLPATVSVLEALQALGEVSSPTYINGILWLQSQDLDTTDYLSERIHALSVANDDQTILLSYLDELITGAWGGYVDYEANNLDTAYAVLALNKINYPDLDTVGYAFSYLIDNQNLNGGFGFYPGGDSYVYMTAVVVQAFNSYNDTFDFQSEINGAAAYLLTKQNADGGFGSDESTVYETALSLIALIESGQGSALPIQDAINYLHTTQLPNGSWNDDAYSTALALRVLHISASSTTPTTGTVSGMVVDAATNQPLSGVSVIAIGQSSTTTDSTGQFTLSNLPAGNQTITFSLAGYATAAASASTTAGSMINIGTIPLSTNLTTGIVKGVVMDATTGLLLEGTTITITGSFNGSTITGTDGSFIFTDVTPGDITITTSKSGYYTVSASGTILAGSIINFSPQLSTSPPPAGTGNLIGKVYDSSTSQPIQGASILISGGPSTATSAQGAFLINDITPSTYQVTISASGYISQTYQIIISAGTTSNLQTVYLTPALQSSTISGIVKDIETGQPVSEADVIIVETGISTKTNPSGLYNLSGISFFDFEIKASAAGYDSLQYRVTSSGYGLFKLDMDLSQIQLSDLRIVSITAEPIKPVQADIITINATVFNAGYSSASNVLVRFFEGNPANGGVQIGADQSIPSIDPGIPATVSVSFDTTDKPGRRTIFVQVDPLNSIKELEETNNIANGILTVLVPPDLLINSSDITFTPINPTVDTTLSIIAVVRNIGEKEVANAPVSLYKGHPLNGGTLAGNYTIPVLSGNGSGSAIFTLNNLISGQNVFYIIADLDDAVSEMNESNNMGQITVNVSESAMTDLSIYPSDINLNISPDTVPGEIFTIYSNVHNTGSTDIQTNLAYYNGNPDNGGILLGTSVVTVPAFETKTVTENLYLPAGIPVIYVSVDPNNLVAETVETNNIAFIEMGASNLPDFVITEYQTHYSPSRPTTKSQVIIEADIFNYGGVGGYAYTTLYEGDPDNGGVLIGTFSYGVISNYIDPNNFKTPTITLSNLSLGVHEFYIVVDPNKSVNEVNETNNKVKVTIDVTSDPKIDLSITNEDITFSPEYPLVGEIVSPKANIYNAGSESVQSAVSFYRGNPLSGGTRIYRGYFTFKQESSTQITSPGFYMSLGVPEIFVVLDEDNLVAETDEDNNSASRTVDTYMDDLSIATKDISLNPALPQEGDIVSIDITVNSKGLTTRTAVLKLYEGDPQDGVLIGAQNFTATGIQSVPVSFPSFMYPGRVVLTAVIENISPSDYDQSNNTATATYGEWIEDGTSNEGTDFWLAWPTRVNSSTIVIQSKYSANYTIFIPGANGVYREVLGTVSPGVPAKIPLGADAKISFTNDRIENKGIHIISDKDISVIFHLPQFSSTRDETYLGLPTSLLGTEYFVMHYTPVVSSEPAEYTIIAIEDNTNIKAGNNIINLNRGQTYYHYSPTDLTGTHVESDKRVALIASTVGSDIPKAVPRVCCADSMLEQMLPVSLLGTDYMVAPLYSPKSGERYRISAARDNTDITINFIGYQSNISLNSTEWIEFEYEYGMHITSTQPIVVMQYSQGKQVSGTGDPSQLSIIPTDKLKLDYRFYSYQGYEEGNFVTIVAPEEDTTIFLDGILLDAARLSLPDKGVYMIVPVGDGEHIISAEKPIAIYVYGYRDYGSYGYPGGIALPIANLTTNMNISPSIPFEGQLAEITGVLINNGDKWARNVVVRAFNGDPMNGGMQIGEDIYFDVVYPKETNDFEISWNTYGYRGTNNIYLIADPDDVVKESKELDNTVMQTVDVLVASKPDLSLVQEDVTLSNPIVSEGETVALTVKIKNRGAAVGNIPVALYIGDPENSGTLLDTKEIFQIVPLGGDKTLTFTFNTKGFKASNTLSIVIDPDNIIDESVEDNNTATALLQVNRARIKVDITTNAGIAEGNEDINISVLLKNESILPWSGTGNVVVKDAAASQVAQVANFTINSLDPLGVEGWQYRVPITVVESGQLQDAVASAQIDFNSLFLSLGVNGVTIDLNSIRVLEFDFLGNFLGEKNSQFEKDPGFDPVTHASGIALWLMDGVSFANSPRYFYLYFDSIENGVKPEPVNTDIPRKGKLIAFSGRWGDIYTVKVNNDGTFTIPVLADQVSLSLLYGFGFDDLNNDGYPDIISGDARGDVYFHANAADNSNTFLPKVKIGNIEPTSTSYNILQPVVSADYNRDGHRDFIINTANSELYLFYGNGDGSFSKELINHYLDRSVTGKASADLNNDGYDDIVTGDNRGGISVLFNNNGQGFEPPAEFVKIYNGNIYSLDTGDIDGDGYTDILFSMYNGVTYIMKGKASGLFGPAEQISSFVAGNCPSYELFDINGDGILDLMAAQNSPSDIFYFEGNGDGSFKTPVNIPTNTTYATAVEVSETRIAPDVIANIGNPEIIENQIYQFTWNTGSTLIGNYSVNVVLYDTNSNPVAEDSASFSIVSTAGLTAGFVLDKISYNPNELVRITSTVSNGSVNRMYDDITATITIKNPSGLTIFTESTAINLLAPLSNVSFNSSWNTVTNVPGDYPVVLEVENASGSIISTGTKILTINSLTNPSVLLSGQISVDKQSLLQGQPVNIAYTVTNSGNIDLSQVDLSILTLNIVDLTTYDTLTDHTALMMSQTYASSQSLNTNNYTAKDYLVILRANIDGIEETLAGTYFRVEGGPSAPSLHSPQNGADVESLTPVLEVNNASDPNDDDLTYQFEIYSDSGMSDLTASSPMVTEEINTTSWQLPLELMENQIYYWRARACDGILYGEWMLPASFRVNLVNDPPTAPTLSSPADYAEADTLTPVLTVNNASDSDSDNLTYNFEIAYDIDFTQIVANEIGVFEGNGTTSWQTPVNLAENTLYFWRTQADDWFIEGPWMTPARFFINTANDAPTVPSIIHPLNRSELTTLFADITISNSFDPDSTQLSYLFELDTVNTFDSAGLIRSSEIPEGQGTTAWRAEGLSDNTYYYVRAKANDGLAESPWSDVVSFFVNTSNEAPTTPALANPSNGSGVNVFSPVLSVHNSTDVDHDVLTYEFELYDDALMTNLVASATGITESDLITSWTVSVILTENNTYYWRARAFDGELYSTWMVPASFMINTANDAPGAPLLNSPADGSSLDTLTPVISVYNAEDPDSDILIYDFEIYSGGVLIQSISAIPQNVSDVTSVALNTALIDNTTYNWRARAYDGDRYGAWMDMASFSIHLPVTNITATIDFDPNTLNKKSKGNWVVVYIELPAGYNVADIILSSILLNGVIPSESWPYNLGDYDKDGIPDLMVKFNRNSVINLLPNGDNVSVEVRGTAGTTTFEGFDVIRVIP